MVGNVPPTSEILSPFWVEQVKLLKRYDTDTETLSISWYVDTRLTFISFEKC